MSDFYYEKESLKSRSEEEDFYAGCYWGNHPYESNELAGWMSDKDLKSGILERPEKNNTMNSDIVIHVKDGVVFLIGHIKSFAEKRSLIGQEIWNTYGVVKILNDLQQVTEPETAGPIKKALEITR